MFRKAVKHESKLRLALAGPSGAGKTYTALLLAQSLVGSGNVAVIDTERGSASKYADLFPFDVNEIESFSPDVFIAAIREAEAVGYGVLVIDSISHEWNGQGGILEIVDSAAKRMKTTNTFSAWGEGTPRHNSFIDAIQRCKMHVICTMRSKEEHVQEKDSNGRTVIRRVGMAPIQREGILYEFDVACELDYEHTLIVTKSRCPALDDAVIRKPDASMAETLKAWLSGAPAPAKAPTSKELYEAGKVASLWNSAQGYFAFAASQGVIISAETHNQMSDAQRFQLQAAMKDAQTSAA